MPTAYLRGRPHALRWRCAPEPPRPCRPGGRYAGRRARDATRRREPQNALRRPTRPGSRPRAARRRSKGSRSPRWACVLIAALHWPAQRVLLAACSGALVASPRCRWPPRWGCCRTRRWSRGPALIMQLLALPIAWTMLHARRRGVPAARRPAWRRSPWPACRWSTRPTTERWASAAAAPPTPDPSQREPGGAAGRLLLDEQPSRSWARVRASSRETCIWEMPTSCGDLRLGHVAEEAQQQDPSSRAAAAAPAAA